MEKTHKLGGKMWLIGGIIIAISSVLLDTKLNFNLLIIITGIITIIPIAFSYLIYKREKENGIEQQL